MKIVKRDVFVALDGQAFLDHEECVAYEDKMLSAEFSSLLGKEYNVEDFNFSCIISYEQFKKFVTDNRNWVLENVLNISSAEKEDEHE